MRILAIDPGPQMTAVVVLEDGGQPTYAAKLDNATARLWLQAGLTKKPDLFAIEMVACYGLAVGRDVFQTCVEIGRFIELSPCPVRLIERPDVKLHICGSRRAKDTNIRQALIDRYGGKDVGIGNKKSPGPLYGISGDCWAALAVAITAADTLK